MNQETLRKLIEMRMGALSQLKEKYANKFRHMIIFEKSSKDIHEKSLVFFLV